MSTFPAGSTLLYVSSSTGMQIGDTVEIMLDNNEFFKTTISSIAGPQIFINNPIPYSASAGNIFIDLSQSNNVAPVSQDNV